MKKFLYFNNTKSVGQGETDISKFVDYTETPRFILNLYDQDDSGNLISSESNLDTHSVNQQTLKLFVEEYDSFNNFARKVEYPLTFLEDPSIFDEYNHKNYVEVESKRIIISNLRFDLDRTYILELGEILVLGHGNIEKDEIRFRVSSYQEVDIINQGILRNTPNDTIWKMMVLPNMLDGEFIIRKSKDVLDFEHEIIEYLPEDKKYRIKQDENLEPIKVKYENSKILEKIYLKEYLWEFERYFDDLNKDANKSKYARIKTRDQLQTLKFLLSRNATMVNQFKGNLKGIEFVVGTFTEGIGYQLISVDEDIYDTFVYLITTNLPKEFWETDIKPIVHPCGWGVRYVYLNVDTGLPFINRKDHSNEFFWFTVAYRRFKSYIESFNTKEVNYILKEPYNLIPSKDLLSEKKFNFKISKYLENTLYSIDPEEEVDEFESEGYQKKALEDEIHSKMEFESSITRTFFKIGDNVTYNHSEWAIEDNLEDDLWRISGQFGTRIVKDSELSSSVDHNERSFDKLTVRYTKEGIGTKYRWRLMRGDVLLFERVTSAPIFEHLVDNMTGMNRMKVELFVERGDWFYYVGEWKFNDHLSSGFYGIKSGRMSALDLAFSGIHESISLALMNPFLTISSLSSERKISLDMSKSSDIKVVGSDGFIIQDLVDEIYESMWIRSDSPKTLSVGCSLDGVATKYVWNITINSKKVKPITTSENFLNYKSSTSGEATVFLSIDRNGTIFDLPAMTITI